MTDLPNESYIYIDLCIDLVMNVTYFKLALSIT